MKEETDRKQEEAQEIRKKIKELEEDKKEIDEALEEETTAEYIEVDEEDCLLYTSPSPRDSTSS
eukprot:6913281-Prorocentrum_lima.AAC.1